MAVVCAVSWILIPSIRLVRYLATSPRLDRSRLRAITVCFVAIAGTLSLLYFVPFPSSFKAPGIVKAFEYTVVVNKIGGSVERVVASPGTRVKPGDPLVHLRNDELDYKIEEARATLREALANRMRALLSNQADLKPINSLIDSINKNIDRLSKEREELVVIAETEGIWVASNIEDYVGMWVLRGTPLGQLVNDQTFYFASVVSQKDAFRVFSDEIHSSEVKLVGQSEITIPVFDYVMIPAEQTELPSVALGFGAGGELAIDISDTSGTIAAEPFYEVRLEIVQETEAELFHGRSGRVKFLLSPEPLLKQWGRQLWQLLQRRYQL
jgi:putative peptide zinc metalloprotease protein